jgi:NitT/TauT family transport system substrate-binding protein
MNTRQADGWTRRRFLRGLTVAGTVGLLGLPSRRVAAEPPPETTTLKLMRLPSICEAPVQVAGDLLVGEGFSDVQYVQGAASPDAYKALAAGDVHLALLFAGGVVTRIDMGAPLVLLGGIHVGCFELFGSTRVHSVRDLKGKTVAIPALGSHQHLFVASIAAYVGLDPRTDIHWAIHRGPDAMQLLAEDKIDGLMGFPPELQELRAKQIGHVVVNSTLDHPWSQYFCCMVAANRDFVRAHPVASKRALRALLKATDRCALEPMRAAQLVVERGYTPRYDYALQTLQEIPYNRWREYDPEDTVRFYALRLQEAGMIQSTPQKIIAQGTDWRFLNELKQELKG